MLFVVVPVRLAVLARLLVGAVGRPVVVGVGLTRARALPVLGEVLDAIAILVARLLILRQ